MTGPRVTAEHVEEPETITALCDPHPRTTVGVELRIQCDHDDIAAAHAALDRAVHAVREQLRRLETWPRPRAEGSDG